jgi:hypothetical protein
MMRLRSRLAALAMGAAFAWLATFPVSHARAGAGGDSRVADDLSVSDDEPPDEQTAPDDQAAADQNAEEESSDEGEMVEVVEDPDDPDDAEGGEEEPSADDPDEERRTMSAYLGSTRTSIEEPDGTLRPPPRLPVIGAPAAKASGAGAARGNGAAGSGGSGGATGGGAPGGGGNGANGGSATSGAKKPGGRIFGGTIVRNGVTWQAELYGPFPIERWSEASRHGREPWEVRHYCGGSLIARDWVLTAAHCVYAGMAEKGFRIRLGGRDISRDDGVTFAIDRIVVHPGWNEASMYVNDIALIHIVADQPKLGAGADPKRPPEYAPIPLHRGPSPADRQAVRATGWGKTKDVNLDKGSAVLLQADMNVVAQPRCAALPGYGPQKIHGGVVCAAAPARQTCRGDSGGPIVFADGAPVLVGVVSWGKERCAGDNQPGVYTRVAAYTTWIDGVIRAGAR